MLKRIISAVLVLLLTVTLVESAVIKLKDGTTVEGEYQLRGNNISIVTNTGRRMLVPASEVLTIDGKPAAQVLNPSSTPAGTSPGTASPSGRSTPSTPSQVPGTPSGADVRGSSSLQATRAKADTIDQPIIGVQLWEKFIASNPSPADLAIAQAELETWQKKYKEKWEKVNGKWIGGDELKDLKKKVESLIKEAVDDLNGSNTLNGFKKLEDAVKLYPSNFQVQFELGYYYLVKGAGSNNNQYIEKAIKSLEIARKINPLEPAVLTNLAICHNFRSRYEQSVLLAYDAVKLRDTKELVQNLVNAISYAPEGMRQNNTKVRPIMEQARILASKHSISGRGGWAYVRPDPNAGAGSAGSGVEDTRVGIVGNGSGFVVTPDGYVLTNRHVVAEENSNKPKAGHVFRARFDDGTEVEADVVAIDEKFDVALLKLKPAAQPYPHLKILDRNPNPAARAMVLGYPATFSSDYVMQVAAGAVKSINPGDLYEVWFDLSTTRGNSGGPIVDRSGNVIGILSAGREVYNVTYVLGVGPLQIKQFFERIGDKAPGVEWTEPTPKVDLDNEELAVHCRKSTLLILIVKTGNKSESPGGGPSTQPATPQQPSTPQDPGGAPPEIN